MAPNDAVMVTSWAGCDVVGAGGCIAPCEGACEDHEGVPGAVDHRARGYSDRPSPGDIHPHIGWCHSFLLLSSIAEPDPNNLFFQLEAVSEASDLLGRRLRILIKVLL